MEFKDYYKILGIDKSANKDEIKRAYRKLARKYHPDVSKEQNAEEKFKEAKEAYEVLSDPEKHKAYDNLGANWRHGQDFTPPPDWGQAGGGGFYTSGFTQAGAEDFSDFFSELFGQRGFQTGKRSRQGFQTKGQDARVKVLINLEDAYHGATKQINLQVPEVDQHGRLINKTKSLKVKIPKGVIQGQQIRLSGQGEPGMGGGPAGDLYLEIEFQEHPYFSVQGKDIYLTVPLAPWEAALGTMAKVMTLGGELEVKIPAGSQSGKKLRLKSKGLPAKESGDQLLLLQIITPPADTEAKRKLYETMAKEMAFNPRVSH